MAVCWEACASSHGEYLSSVHDVDLKNINLGNSNEYIFLNDDLMK